MWVLRILSSKTIIFKNKKVTWDVYLGDKKDRYDSVAVTTSGGENNAFGWGT